MKIREAGMIIFDQDQDQDQDQDMDQSLLIFTLEALKCSNVILILNIGSGHFY